MEQSAEKAMLDKFRIDKESPRLSERFRWRERVLIDLVDLPMEFDPEEVTSMADKAKPQPLGRGFD